MPINRREFLEKTAAAGALAALAPELEGAHRKKKETRTLFFNFSNHPSVDKGNFYAFIEGNVHALAPARNHPALRAAQRTNAFLAALQPGSVTHVLENVQTSADSVSLSYTFADADPANGTWSMSHVFFLLPTASLSHAYRQAKKSASPGQPLNLSAKREFYGAAPAANLQDLIDENSLVDSNEHASALTMIHPDVLNFDTNSASHIKTNYVDTSSSTKALGKKIYVLGPAAPVEQQNLATGSGWATMTPITDDNGQPLKYDASDPSMGGLIMYQPVINPQLGSFLAASTNDASTSVKSDTTLGADISGGIPGAGNLQGKIWSIHNGLTSVDQSAINTSLEGHHRLQLAEDNVNFTLVKVNDDAGYALSGGSTQAASGLVNIDLEATNSFVRWLAIYIVFRDEKGNVISAKDLPLGISVNSGLDLPDALYLGVVTPQFTIYGAPVQDSTLKISFTWPQQAYTAEVLASGLGGPNASHYYPQTEVIGIVMTTLTCFVIPAFVLALAAVPGIELLIGKLLAAPLVNTLISEVLALWELADGDKAALFTIFWRALAKAGIAATFAGLKLLIEALVILAVSVENCLRASAVAGLIVQLIGMAGIAADIARATHDVVVSPWTYRTTLTVTHDISVNLAHDSGSDTFPAQATHYIATAVFDDGMPHRQTLPMPSPPVASLPPVVFNGVPLGGKVNLLVGFYADSGWQAGQGETGILDNFVQTFQAVPTITLTQNLVPIDSSTHYEHKSKIALDAGGNRVWQATAVGPAERAAGACDNAPGQLCAFRKITVRQGTSATPGDIGYAWGAYSSNVHDCSSGGSGQLDQLANIGTVDPQSRYASTACGLNPGAKLSYNLQGNQSANYYLDSNTNLLRLVRLDTPGFADPRQKQALGQLNLDSTDLLLHPGGRVISVNAANHKLESLRLPSGAVTDDEAATNLRADLYSGQGSRPGLMHTPAAAAITAHGVVLVLESGNSRIQSLDTCANPVALFSKQPQQNSLQLAATDSDDFEYLDLAVEYSGYIYVLSRNLNSSRYRLDIYHPSQGDTNPISTTFDMNAARIAVDLWRNVYTLNYEVLKMPDGSIPSTTEPTVSLWVPSAPAVGAPPPGRGHRPRPKPNSAFSAPRPLRRRYLLTSLVKPWRIA